MAKNEPKVPTPSEPTLPSSPTEKEEPTTEPEIPEPVSTLPEGVSMHDAGVLPNTANRAEFMTLDPKRPPPGWKGTFNSCGGCGDFLGNSERCPKCAPVAAPNVYNHGGVAC